MGVFELFLDERWNLATHLWLLHRLMQPPGNPAFTMTFLNPRPERVELIDPLVRMVQERLKLAALNLGLTNALASTFALTLSVALRILTCSCSVAIILIYPKSARSFCMTRPRGYAILSRRTWFSKIIPCEWS